MTATLSKLRDYHRMFGWRGVSLALRSRLGRGPQVVSVSAPGVPAPVYLRLKTSDVWTYQQIFFDHEYEVALDRKPSVIVDAGANVGLASIFFACKYPEARILAIEPEASNFALLKQNVAPYSRVVPLQAALWKENTFIDLFDPGIGHWGFQACEAGRAEVARRLGSVPGLTIDRLMADHGLSHVDILKIDIEGGEREVFEDASRWIGRVGVVMVELHDHFKVGCSRNFYLATQSFDREVRQGERVIMLRKEYAPAGGTPPISSISAPA